MAMFTFYGDESYAPNTNAYAVSGYIATVEQWEEWEREWRELGRGEGFTILHKRLLETNVKGSVFEWPDLTADEKREKKKRINSRACDIILRRVNAGFTAAISKTEWKEIVAESRWAAALGKSFYAAGVYVCLNLISMWIEQFPNRRDPIDGIRYVFEEGADGRDEAEAMIREFKRDERQCERYKIKGYSFEKKKDVWPLQAADFLAYESYRHIDNQLMGEVKRDSRGMEIPTRQVLKRLVQHDDPRYRDLPPANRPTPHYGFFMEKEHMAEILSGLEESFPDGPAPLNPKS